MSLTNYFEFLINYFKTIPIQNLHTFGYFFVFLSALLEAIPIFGLLLPGQSIIVISGFLAYNDLMNIYILLIVSSAGAIFGDLISFYIGKKYGFKFLKKYGKYILIDTKKNKEIQKLISENLGKTVFIGRFNSITRALVPFISGSMNINFFKFSYFNIITGIIWSSTWVLVGFIAGKSFEIVAKYLGYGILIATILSVGIWLLFKYLKDKKLIYSKSDVIIVLINIFSIYLFSKITEDILNKEFLLTIDTIISNNIHLLWSPILNNFMLFITNFADKIFIIIFTLFLVGFLFSKKRYTDIYFYLISIISSSILVVLIKNLIQRLRPIDSLIQLNSYSFPSGHATLSIIISICIYFIFIKNFKKTRKEKIKKYLFLFVIILYPIIIGFSRIYLNVHYFFDVIAGFSLGAIIVTSMYLISKYFKKKSKF